MASSALPITGLPIRGPSLPIIINCNGNTLSVADLKFAHLDQSKPFTGEDASWRSLEEINRNHIVQVLQACHWQIEGESGAAARLQLKPSTLRSRMRKLNIERAA